MNLDPRLNYIIERSADFRQEFKKAKKRAFRPPRSGAAEVDQPGKGCRTCRNLPPDEHCVRSMEGRPCEDVDAFKERALTSAPPGDRLHPKVCTTM